MALTMYGGLITLGVCMALLQSCLAVEDATRSIADAERKQERIEELVHRLIHKAGSKVRPNVHIKPVDVAINFYIISFGSINEVDMDYTFDIYLREVWQDPRLVFDSQDKPVIVPPDDTPRVWSPDIFFPNEKHSELHTITVPNRHMKIWPNGTVAYSIRMTIKHSCPMILTHFPLDTQYCHFKIESYGHEMDDLILRWSGEKSIEVNDELTLPQFTLQDVALVDCVKSYSTGNYPCLKVRFTLVREIGFYMLQTYIPSILIVILSWVSFWINADAVPARISLGVTTVLTMATALTGSRENAPKVAYPKAIDVWMAMCMIFVFGALLEYALVNVLYRRDQNDYKKTDQREPETESFGHVALKSSLLSGGEPNGNGPSKKFELEDNDRKSMKVEIMPRCQPPHSSAVFVDRLSRWLFPGTFLLFNIFYWLIYALPRHV